MYTLSFPISDDFCAPFSAGTFVKLSAIWSRHMQTETEAKNNLTVEVANLYPPQGEWTEHDYFTLPDTNHCLELSEGRLIMPPHPTFTHQEVLKRLFFQIHAFVERNLLGIIQMAPLPVRLWAGKIREPDIFFIGKEHADRIGEQFCGVPDLIVEIISSGTRRVDRTEKFYEYAKAGVREYWMVDHDEKTIEVYTLKEGAYILLGKYSPGQVAKSEILSGLDVAVKELFLP